MNAPILEIDGSYGEGGGQLLRTTLALSAVTGREIRIYNIRARRARTGLAPQHLAAVRAAAALCAARVDGLDLHSRELQFRPGPIRGGYFEVDVGTAGSVTLVLQAVLPIALRAPQPVSLVLIGGTDVEAAPPIDYVRYVLLPLISRMGAKVIVRASRRGYYPRGGGRVEVEVKPSGLRRLALETAGPLEGIHGIAHVGNLAGHIVERMKNAVEGVVQFAPLVEVKTIVYKGNEAVGQGGAIVLWACMRETVLGAGIVAKKGLSAEHVAETAIKELMEEIRTGATLDIHAMDQILIYAALAAGCSRFAARYLSEHARTTLWVLEQFIPIDWAEERQGSLTGIRLGPRPN